MKSETNWFTHDVKSIDWKCDATRWTGEIDVKEGNDLY